ncbi:hypothetical protein BJV74DRAFT_903458 [Russula compacta]|nr:hypothetical protein BJV74DRAFT_903458 [Russula compacta]
MHHTPMAPTHAHVPLARASLDSSKYASVNAFLKSLKLHTRTLSALFAQHTTELAVLERLYYINNNQHRPALFWQRIVEARRYSRRLRSLDVPLLVDGLRRSFHGDINDASSKLQKGAWTHYPSAHALKSFTARLRTCTALLDKVRFFGSATPSPNLHKSLIPDRCTDLRAYARDLPVRVFAVSLRHTSRVN